MLEDTLYSGQKLLNRKQGGCPFCASVKDNQILHSNRDFPPYPHITLSNLLCTQGTAGSQNVPSFSLRILFLQAQSHMSKRKTSFLQLLSQATQPNKEDVLPTTASRPAKAFHSSQTSANSILHECWFAGQISFSPRKRNLVTLFYCPY